LGSTASGVVTYAHCHVLVVRWFLIHLFILI
jgi:nucleotide-binding universal stress UspA family protein